MTQPTRMLIVIVGLMSLLLGRSAQADVGQANKADFSDEQIEFFEAKIRPLLAKHCYECHSGKAKKLQAELRLDGRSLAIKGGENGAAVVPGKPAESALIAAVRWESYEMPPQGKLKPGEVDLLVRWVKDGAAWPDEQVATTEKKKSYDWPALRKSHWAWRPLVRPAAPKVKTADWPRTDIDRFLLARLEDAGLLPSEPATPRVLIRRIYFHLVGLPPDPEEVAEFVAACQLDRPTAVADLSDRLLDSPHYGERWGRHWLDVARYSDGFGGFLDNQPLPNAWRYRDWVIEAFNQDLPYNEFIKQQIASDLMGLPANNPATGFFALGPTYKSDGGDPDSVAQAKAETLADRIDTFSRGMLGLTVSCARCHDHKFDPIAQQDYYALAGIFNNSNVGNVPLAPPDVVKTFDDHQNEIRQREQQLKQLADRLKKANREASADEKKQRDVWQKQLLELKKASPPGYDVAHGLRESGSADMAVAIRGDLRKPGENAPRRFLQILAQPDLAAFASGSGRRGLADATASTNNPLLARVMVNRIWLHHFGKAIVRSPSNFGSLGQRPTHPLLLDWLASEFIEGGWSVKDLHRTIIQSAAYQMSSRYDEVNFAADGDNKLIWRMNPRRIDVESWRDGLLRVTGALDLTSGGPPTDDVNSKRRTLYFRVSRNGDRFAADEFLRLFDFPLMRASVAKRPTSIVPQQYLFMMNSSFMVSRAKALATRLQQEAKTDTERIVRAYQLLFGRRPSERERTLGVAFLSAAEPTPPKESNKENGGAAKSPVLMIADFEGSTYGDWKVEGKAFGPGPAQGTLPGQMNVTGFLGSGLINTYFNGDGTTGVLTSPLIKVERRWIHFLVGGGKYPGETCINLLRDGKVVRTATGPNDRGGGSEKLNWATWDVAEFAGKDVQFQIVDRREKGGWGHINVDHIVQSDRPVDASLPTTAASTSGLSRWQQYAQVLLSSNEFMYVE